MKTRRAFSYARFSSAKQADGYSLARQTEAAQRYCERNGLTLDEQTFVDLGVSGYHGSNSQAGDLGVFIDLVKDGRIPRGSVLIVENTDRLSRLPPDEANRIITTIVRAGVDIVTTNPEQVYTATNIDKLSTWLPLQVSNCLAHEESLKKSDRVKDAWQRKRAALVQGTAPLTKKCPFWLEPSDDRKTWVVKPHEADLMRKVFQWCIDGLGAASICGKLHELHPSGITGKGWQPNNLRKIMRSRQVLGELQPRTGTTARKGGVKSTLKASGQPIVGYFPPIISEADFYKVQTLLDARTHGGGRTTGTPNLFNGILFDALDGHPMVLSMGRNKRRMLVTRGALRKVGGSEFRAVRYDIFEHAILSKLVELKTADVTGAASAEDAVGTWSAKLTLINHKIATAQDRAAKADDPDVFLGLLETYGTERKAIITGLEAAKQSATNPVGDALGECTSLVALLSASSGDERDELRRRVRAALARIVEGIWVVSVPRGRARLIAVRIQFRGGRHRDYLIAHIPPDRTSVRSFTAEAAALDLRNPDHVRDLEGTLQKLELTARQSQ